MKFVGQGFILCSTLVSSASVIIIIGILLLTSSDAALHLGFDIFTTSKWNPSKGDFGLLSMLYGSVVITTLALALAVPIGIFAAIYISEVLNTQYRILVKSMLELLAGVPSVIYGLLGVVFLSSWLTDIFNLESGRTLLAGALLLATMILPTIITLCDDTFTNISPRCREAARGLGLYRSEVIFSVILPLCKGNIIQIVLLALGRAMGETMAVMLVIGNLDRLPNPLSNLLVPGQTITSKIGREIGETAFGSLHFSALILTGVVLLLIILLLTIIAQLFYTGKDKVYE